MAERSSIDVTSSRTGPSGNGADRSMTVLLVGSSADRARVRERIARTGLGVEVVTEIADAVSMLATREFAVCLIDLTEERFAIAAIRVLRSELPEQPVAGIINPANPVGAGEALAAGLMDLLPWPFEDRDLLMIVSNARDRHGVEIELARPGTAAEALFAQSAPMRAVLDRVQRASQTTAGVCVCGEPGTGRELVARVIHAAREQVSGTFVAVDCHGGAAQPLERVLFGTAAARAARPGAPECVTVESAILRARGGTLYLTHLVDAPARVQARLARVLRDGEVTVAGEPETVELDIRPIGSFEPGVEAALGDGRLSRDLFGRLAQIRIDLPPLRRRRQDIPLLATHFLEEIADLTGAPRRVLSRSALAVLTALPWQGNASELRMLLETVVRSVPRPVIQIEDLLEHAALEGISPRIDVGVSLRDARARFERECISAVLQRCHGRVGEAARVLGIQRTNLYRKVRQLNVERSLLSARK
jgi:DNA-binding NtrC family response regulator